MGGRGYGVDRVGDKRVKRSLRLSTPDAAIGLIKWTTDEGRGEIRCLSVDEIVVRLRENKRGRRAAAPGVPDWGRNGGGGKKGRGVKEKEGNERWPVVRVGWARGREGTFEGWFREAVEERGGWRESPEVKPEREEESSR